MFDFGAKKTRTAKKRGPRRSDIHLHKVRAVLKFATDATPAQEVHIFLNDITSQDLSLYAPMPFPTGSRVTLAFEMPKPFTIDGNVAWCSTEQQGSRIISIKPRGFRAGIVFIFSDDAQKQAAQDFFALLKSGATAENAAATKAAA